MCCWESERGETYTQEEDATVEGSEDVAGRHGSGSHTRLSQASTLNQRAEVNGCISEDGMTRGMRGHVFLMKQPDNNRLPQGAAWEGRNLTLVFLYIAGDVSRTWVVVFTASKVCGWGCRS